MKLNELEVVIDYCIRNCRHIKIVDSRFSSKDDKHIICKTSRILDYNKEENILYVIPHNDYAMRIQEVDVSFPSNYAVLVK